MVALCDFPARRIALLKPSALGDIVHSLPVLTALRRRYPDAHITWIVNRSYQPLLEGHPDLNATLPFDRTAGRRGFTTAVRQSLSFLAEVRRARFDLVVDLQGLFRTGVMALASGARRRVGLAGAREGAQWFYTDVVPVRNAENLHAVDRYWLAAAALGAGDGPKTFHVPIAPEARAWTIGRLRDLPRPWLALGVGSRWLTKRWLPEHFAELVRRAHVLTGGSAVFVGGGDETPLAQQALRALAGIPSLDLTGKTTLTQLAAVLAAADVMIANDTGPLHLAAALGRPVVAPYTCTSVRLTGPYAASGGAVETAIWCQGSRLKRCARMECMRELTPDRLWPVLDEVLRRWQSVNRSA